MNPQSPVEEGSCGRDNPSTLAIHNTFSKGGMIMDEISKEDLLSCPFCGGKVDDHPTEHWNGTYFVCFHEENCFLGGSKPPFNFTLIPKNYMVERWQHRAGRR